MMRKKENEQQGKGMNSDGQQEEKKGRLRSNDKKD
jgi:hypothetical protein